ncbi:MAG: DUF1553 domain-containing protein [Gemmataceae bacterium]
MPLPRRLLLAACILPLIAGPLAAKPAHKQALATHLGPFLSAKLNACVLCHQTNATDEDEKPHNPFGARLKTVRAELQKAGRKTDIVSRFEAIAEEDSDGDGVPNLIEILTGHNPGDPKDRPTEVEIAQAKKTVAAFRKYLAAYPWRPFEPVRRPELPQVKDAGWVRNPIDRFIAAEHAEHGLTPRPEANKATLLRRVCFDLTGLPPMPEELHAFLNDSSPDAYEKAVDRLLASPRYGERWGRHWMDVWRYSDWAGWGDGNQIRDSQPHIWRWRDWIIESLNADKGYDRMILEMFAGDEIAPDDPSRLRATGYLVRNYKMLSREKWLQDTVDHTFLAFQGVTIGCAKCHDHMYDPILQKEYYQVRAIFTPHQVRIDRLPGQPDTKKDGIVHAYDADVTAPTFLLIRGDDRTPDKTPLPPGVPAALGGRFDAKPVPMPISARTPDKREFVIQETLAASAEAITQAQKSRTMACRFVAGALAPAVIPFAAFASAAKIAKAADALALADLDVLLAEAKHAAVQAVLKAEQLEDEGKKDSPEWKTAALAASIAQKKAALREAQRNLLAAEQARRDVKAPPQQVTAAEAKLKAARTALTKAETDVKAAPTTAYTPRPLTNYPAASSGRRLAFAKWLSDSRNPLTARVAVNHIWLRHFGQAIVPSVFDFGRNGRPPSHAALLDWLAAEFMQPSVKNASPWSMKHLHRLIVTSATYRQASTPDISNVALDHDNRYLWRFSPHRLEAEAVRDALLYVAGRLDLTMSGPDIDQHQGLSVFRRSLYFRHAAEKQVEFLKLFDAAAVTECYQRKESIIPQQALALANSELTIRLARLLARDLAKTHADPAAFVSAAFERTLSRPPSASELAECLTYLRDQEKALPATKAAVDADGRHPAGDSALRAREGLVQVLLNHHEFVTVR